MDIEPNKIPKFNGIDVSNLEVKMIQKKQNAKVFFIVLMLVIVLAGTAYAGWNYYNSHKITSSGEQASIPAEATTTSEQNISASSSITNTRNSSTSKEIGTDIDSATTFDNSDLNSIDKEF